MRTIRENYVYLTTRNRERIFEGYGRNVQYTIDTTNTYHRRCVVTYIADKKEVCREFHFKGKIWKKLSSIRYLNADRDDEKTYRIFTANRLDRPT